MEATGVNERPSKGEIARISDQSANPPPTERLFMSFAIRVNGCLVFDKTTL